MNSEIDPTALHINATLVGDRPMVYWAYQGKDGTITVAKARERAQQLFQAVAVAESEAAIVRGIRATPDPDPPRRGFGKPAAGNQERSALVLQLIRRFRPPLPAEIQVIFGHRTQIPLIQLSEGWYGASMQLDMAEAEGHAMHLLGAAEAAESDAFLYYFQEQAGLTRVEANALVQEFGLFRQRNQLEELFGRGESHE